MLRILKLFLAINLALAGSLGPSQARMKYDANGTDRMRVPRAYQTAAAQAAVVANNLYTSGLLTSGLPSFGNVIGADPASNLTSNLTGLVINSAARTYTYDGTGTVGNVAAAITETPVSGAPKTSAVTILPAMTGNLKISGRLFFVNDPAMFLILAGYASTSQLSVSSDDGTAISVGANSQGYPLASTTFTSAGIKNLTISEFKSDNSVSISTVSVLVTNPPSAPTTTIAKATAARLNAAVTNRKPLNVGSNPPAITINTGNSTVNNRTLTAGGSTSTSSVPDGQSGTGGVTTLGATAGGYILADTTQGLSQNTYGNGGSKRFLFTSAVGSHFDFKYSYSGTSLAGSTQFYITYTDDADSPYPTWYKATARQSGYQQGIYYVDVTFPTPPVGAGKRAVEIFTPYGNSITGFNFESGATIGPFTSSTPTSAAWNDSFDWGQGAVDQTLGTSVHVAMDVFGSRKGVNHGHRTNAWARLGGTIGVHAYVADRIGSNPFGFDEATKWGSLDIMFGHMSINDNSIGNYTSVWTGTQRFANPNGTFVAGPTTLQNMLRLAFRRMRYVQPSASIVIDTGFAGPPDVQNATYINAIKATFDTVFASDPLANLVDLTTATYRWMGQTFTVPNMAAPVIASGAIGSSIYFPPSAATFTADITGNVLNVTAISAGRIETGLVLNTTPVTRVVDFGTGTGQTGTYILEYAPGDSSGVSYNQAYDYVHPNQLGQTVWGQARGNAAAFIATKAAALQ